MTQTEVPYFWHCVTSSFMEDPFSTLSTQMILLKHRAYSLCHLWSKSMIVLMIHCSCSYFAKLCCNMKSWNISSVEKDFFSHTLALCWWFFKMVICEKALLHLSHLYGFSPVWDRLCLCKNSFFILLNLSLFRKFPCKHEALKNPFPQSWHQCVLSLLCCFLCRMAESRLLNSRPQSSHWKGFRFG